MRRRILPRILAVGILVLALAGCVRFQADLTLTPDDTVDGSIVVAVLAQDESDESRDAALTAAQQIESSLLGTLRDAEGVTTSDYAEDDYVGSRIEFAGVALDAFSGRETDSLAFTREGDEYLFTGALDFGDASVPSDGDEEADDGNLTVSVTFPGAVTEHDGELSGTTVSWTTTLDERVEMSARGSATPAGPPVVLIVVLALIVLVVLAAVVGLILFLRSRAATGSGGAPVAVAGDVALAPAVDPVADAPVAEPPVADPPGTPKA